MRAGHHLGRVRVQTPVVDVEAEGYHAGEDEVLVVLLDGRVAEKEGAGDERPDHHGVLAAEDAQVAQKTCGDGAEDAARVGEGVVAPRLMLGSVEDGATCLEVLTVGRSTKLQPPVGIGSQIEGGAADLREEHLEKRVGQTN